MAAGARNRQVADALCPPPLNILGRAFSDGEIEAAQLHWLGSGRSPRFERESSVGETISIDGSIGGNARAACGANSKVPR
jgi:hypothetical protein